MFPSTLRLSDKAFAAAKDRPLLTQLLFHCLGAQWPGRSSGPCGFLICAGIVGNTGSFRLIRSDFALSIHLKSLQPGSGVISQSISPVDPRARPTMSTVAKGHIAGACVEFADRELMSLRVCELWVPSRHRRWIEAEFRSSSKPRPLLSTEGTDRERGASNGTN